MSYSRYPTYDGVDCSWLGKLPHDWQALKLKRVIDPDRPITYGIVQAGEHVENGIPYIRPIDMSDEGGIKDTSGLLKTSQEIAVSYHRSSLEEGDLVCSIGPSFGKVMVVPKILSGGNLTQGTARIAISRRNDYRYFFWVLRSNRIYEQWQSSVGGATFRALNLGPLSETVVPVPSPSEQTQIARFLDHQTVSIDALIAEQQRLIELLKEKRQAVISHAVTKGLDPDVVMKDSGVEWLGEVPEHWATGRVGWWFDVELGKMLDESRITGESLAPYIRNTDVQWNGINTQDLPVMDFDEADRIRYGLRKGDLLVCEGGEIGRAAIWQNNDFTCFYQKALHRVRARKEGNVHFLKHVLRHYADNGILDGSSTSATINHFTREQFRALSIPFPPAGEQAEIANYIDSNSNDFDALEEQANAGIELLQERRSALISAAVTGKIDVRDWQPPSSETSPEASVNEGATA